MESQGDSNESTYDAESYAQAQAIYEGLPSFDSDNSYPQNYSYESYQPVDGYSDGVKQESVSSEPQIPTKVEDKNEKQDSAKRDENGKEKSKKEKEKKEKGDKADKRKKKRKKRSGSRERSSGSSKSNKSGGKSRGKSKERSKSRSGSRGGSRSRKKKSHRKHKRRSRSSSRTRRSKSKSKSEEKKKKKEKKSSWDVAPDPTAMASQLALIPGAPAIPPTVSPLALGLGQQIPTTAALMANPALATLLQNNPLLSAASAAQTQARRIYVGNVFAHITEEMLKAFLNEKIMAVPGRPPTPYNSAIYSVAIKREKMFAFIEFYSATDADIAICMDGVEWPVNGVPLKIRRPKDYQPPPDHTIRKYHIPGIISTHVDNDTNKVFLGNLPTNLSDEDVKQFVTTFGPLKAFNLVKDLTTGVSKGYAFFSYADPSVTEEACKGLNGINLGGKEVVVQRATINPEKIDRGTSGLHLDMLAPDISLPDSATPALPSRILVLQNCITAEEMKADNSVEILADIEEECKPFGNVRSVVTFESRVFVEYDRIDSAYTACQNISGRKFQNRTVVTCFLPEFDWMRKSLG